MRISGMRFNLPLPLFLIIGMSILPLSPVAQTSDGFTTVNLRAVVNQGWADNGGKVRGWTDQGDNDMRTVKPGLKTLIGIPFDLIDPRTNGGRAVLVMKSNHFPDGPQDVTVPVNHKAASVYFLHASAWTQGLVATYIVHFADGSSLNIPIRAKEEINDWWGPVNGPEYRVALVVPNAVNDDMGMVAFGWNNPYPDKVIQSLEFKSADGEAIPILAAVTLSDKPVQLPPPADIPEPDYLKSDLSTMDMSEWFPIEDKKDPFFPTAIDCSAFLDKPAGKHGFLKNVDGAFVFQDGTPCRMVATDVSPIFPDHQQAIYIARWLAKWGFNEVRFHPLASNDNNGAIDWTRNDTQHLNAANLDKLDFFINELAKRGIYVRLSMLYYKQVKQGDGLDHFDEALAETNAKNPNSKSDTLSTMGITFFDKQAMAANIAVEKAIMTHRNPYRNNVMYGQDPAINMIEVTNEDSTFFYTIDSIPAVYSKELDRLWGAWLLKKYGSRANLEKAWGGNLAQNEDPAKGTVKRLPIWMYQNPFPPNQLIRAQDELRFYFSLNNGYFNNTKEALRAAGVKQPICGSGWQGPNLAFLADLYSNVPGMDYIDRHQYWGGGPGGWQILPGQMFNDATPLTQPDIMLNLSGQRVLNMPFGVSEWANALPNQWRCADPALMAFYGQGLNGWDCPMIFAHDMGFWTGENGFVKYLKWMWPVTSPETLCQYPILSTVIRRGYVEEAKPVFIRNISISQVFGAKPLPNVAIKFHTSGIYEMQESANVTPKSTLAFYAAAVGKTGILFNQSEKPDYSIDLSRYINLKDKVIRSVTGQLTWYYGKGYVTLNAPKIQSAIGFITDIPIKLGDCEIESSNKIATIHVCSWDGKPLSDSKHILICAVARTRNTGMAYTRLGSRLLTLGNPPIIMEGVKGRVTLFRSGDVTVTALDPWGYKVKSIAPKVEPGKIVIPLNGENKAVYYDVRWR